MTDEPSLRAVPAVRPTVNGARGRIWLATGAVIVSAACWGLATVATKGLLDEVPPFQVLALQLAASVGFLWLCLSVMRERLPDRTHLKGILASGALEPGLAYGVGVPGLALTSAANATVIGAAEPAFICALAWILLGARPGRGVAGVLVLASAGVLMVTLSGAEGLGQGRPAGDALVGLGTAFAALYVVMSSRLVGSISPLSLAATQQTAGLACVLILLVGAWGMGFEAPASLNWALVSAAAATGIIQYALAVWFYLMALRILAPSVAGLYLALIPVFGMLGAVLILGEAIGPVQMAGAVLVIGAMSALGFLRSPSA